MKNRSSYAVLTRFGIIAAVLATLVLIAPAASGQSASECELDGSTLKCTYEEKGEDPVATFTADDPDEGEDTIVWGVSDPANFKIADGVLEFKSAPNFESPKAGIDSGTLEVRNVYTVKVQVTDGTDDSAIGEFNVEVTVTDVEEEGSGKLTELQPQVGVQLSVTGFSDPDSTDDSPISGLTWQWSKSMDKAEWTDISGARGDSYTPKVEDIDYYLRAMASYSDRRGDGKTAPIVSDAIVEAQTTFNAAPDFGKQDSDGNGTDETGDATADPPAPFLRTIKENTKGKAVGSPIAATDADDDVLQYTHDGTDMAHFSIDEYGQLTAKTDLNFESSGGAADQCADLNVCVVTVTATDPSGASTTVTVNIAVENANDKPVFGEPAKAQVKLTVNEKIAGAADDAADPDIQYDTTPDEDNETLTEIRAFEATDADTAPIQDVVTYSVGGADGGNFDISTTGVLTFKTDKQPNYEGQKKHEITIMAKDDDDIPLVAELKVVIDVVNLEEAGTVTLSQRKLQVGVPVTAELADPDESISGLRWQWSAQDAPGGGACPTMANPVDSDETSGWVAIGTGTSATITPLASHADSDDTAVGNQAMCLQATANYNDGFDNPAGQDNDAATDVLDESKDVANSAPLANDGSVVEPRQRANEKPTFTKEDANDDGTMEDGSAANPFLRNVDENHKGDFGTTLGVNDDGGGAKFLLFRNGGADADVVDVAEMTAQLKTTAELDYETRTEYMVTVTATDPSLASKMVYVMVTVDNVDDKAVISLVSLDGAAIEYPEKGEDSVATFSATDEDEADDTIEWGVSDTGNFKIEEDDDGNGVLSFKSAPNFEAPKSAITSGTLDVRNVYAVTVTATNGTKGSAVGESKVVVTVTDVEEEGSGNLTELQPQVAVQLRVTGFSDPDSPDGVSGLTWQWSKSMDKAEWTDISAAKGDSYTPKVEDIDYYLRAMASYSDRRGDGKTAPIVSDAIVEAKTTDNSAPDFGKEDSDNDDTDETGSRGWLRS